MKKIAAACALALASFALLSAQAQVPGFSNTVHAAVGQSVEKNAQIKFLGFTEYFTGNVTVGKITFTGDIAWQLIPGSGGLETRFADHNVNVVINPVKGLDIGLGTNLNWTVGPGPSSGPQWSAYNKPYYGGINLEMHKQAFLPIRIIREEDLKLSIIMQKKLSVCATGIKIFLKPAFRFPN